MSRQADATIAAEITGLAERYDMDGLTGLIEVINERLSHKPTGSSIYLLTTTIKTPIVGNLNAMLDQIEELMEDVRRVSDSIAHDLRTPLARLRNRLELL